MDYDIDLNGIEDIKQFVRKHKLKKNTLEAWISAGILDPQEMKMAEKMVRFLDQTI
jgi:hypothetical protein